MKIYSGSRKSFLALSESMKGGMRLKERQEIKKSILAIKYFLLHLNLINAFII